MKYTMIFVAIGIALVGCSKRDIVQPEYRDIHTEKYPPHAVPGKCYTKVLLPSVYRTERDRVLVVPQSYRYVHSPAQYRTIRKSIMTRPAKTQWKNRGRNACSTSRNSSNVVCLEQTPARYRYVNERVMDRPESSRKVIIPAKYRSVSQRVKVRDERLVWREVWCGNSNNYREPNSWADPR
jgi:hypothetical protein